MSIAEEQNCLLTMENDEDKFKAHRQRSSLHPRSAALFAEKASNGRWVQARHLAKIDEQAMRLAKGKIKRLVITTPPRHGKSLYCSQWLPAWFLGTNPDDRVILCSYEAGFAATWGGKTRDVLVEYGKKFFGVEVSGESTARDNWRISGRDGGMVTAGVGGPITGYGCDLLIIDDPIKNAEQAASKTYRDKTWDWWQSTAYTRLEPGGRVLVICTRWNQDDLVGRLLKQSDDDDAEERWEVLNLPAIAEDENDMLGRKPGEALWPQRWPAKKLERRRNRLGEYVWSALYQQRPSPLGGGRFKDKYFQHWNDRGDLYQLVEPNKVIPKHGCWRFAVMDPAGTEKNVNNDPCYTVIQVWEVTPQSDMLLLHQYREQVSTPDAADAAVGIARRFQVNFIGIEKNGIGLGVVQDVTLRGIAVIPIEARGNKESRSETAEIRMAAGKVYFPNNAAFVDALKSELLGFPNGEYCDQVDALSHAAAIVQDHHGAPLDEEDEATREQREKEIEEAVPAGRYAYNM